MKRWYHYFAIIALIINAAAIQATDALAVDTLSEQHQDCHMQSMADMQDCCCEQCDGDCGACALDGQNPSLALFLDAEQAPMHIDLRPMPFIHQSLQFFAEKAIIPPIR